jgi:putative addiction module component (TIGR02574 family)
MSAPTDGLFTEAMKLDPSEREELAMRLLASVDDEEEDSLSLHPDWEAEIAQRVEDVVTGRVKTIPAEEVLREIREQRRAEH